jgi:hypothetical protein
MYKRTFTNQFQSIDYIIRKIRIRTKKEKALEKELKRECEVLNIQEREQRNFLKGISYKKSKVKVRKN